MVFVRLRRNIPRSAITKRGIITLNKTSCFYKKQMNLQGENLYTDIFSKNWYEKSVAIQKDVGFALLRMNRPLYLKALGIGIMNFETLQTVGQKRFWCYNQ